MYTKSSLWAIARTLRCGCQAMHLMQSCSGCDKSMCGPFSSFPTKCFCAKSYASWIILDKVLKKRKKKWIRNGCCITALNTYVSPALFLIFDILKCFFFSMVRSRAREFCEHSHLLILHASIKHRNYHDIYCIANWIDDIGSCWGRCNWSELYRRDRHYLQRENQKHVNLRSAINRRGGPYLFAF